MRDSCITRCTTVLRDPGTAAPKRGDDEGWLGGAPQAREGGEGLTEDLPGN